MLFKRTIVSSLLWVDGSTVLYDASQVSKCFRWSLSYPGNNILSITIISFTTIIYYCLFWIMESSSHYAHPDHIYLFICLFHCLFVIHSTQRFIDWKPTNSVIKPNSSLICSDRTPCHGLVWNTSNSTNTTRPPRPVFSSKYLPKSFRKRWDWPNCVNVSRILICKKSSVVRDMW